MKRPCTVLLLSAVAWTGGCGGTQPSAPEPNTVAGTGASEGAERTDTAACRTDRGGAGLLRPLGEQTVDYNGFTYGVRIVKSCTDLYGGYSGGAAPPGHTYVEAELEITNKAPDRRADAPWVADGMQYYLTPSATDSCEHDVKFPDLCTEVTVAWSDDGGKPGDQIGVSSPPVIEPGGSIDIWAISGPDVKESVSNSEVTLGVAKEKGVIALSPIAPLNDGPALQSGTP